MRSKNVGDYSDSPEASNSAAPQSRLQRRHFLLALGAGGAGAAIVAARTLSGGSASDAAQEPSPESKGYAVTDHIRRYYRTAKI